MVCTSTIGGKVFENESVTILEKAKETETLKNVFKYSTIKYKRNLFLKYPKDANYHKTLKCHNYI